MSMFCVEIGTRQRCNLWRMTTSVVIDAETLEAALLRVDAYRPFLSDGCTVHRVFAVDQVIVDWPTGITAVVERVET